MESLCSHSPFEPGKGGKLPRADRFIPQRSTPAKQSLFSMQLREPVPDVSDCSPHDHNNMIYNDVLQHEILNFAGEESARVRSALSRAKILEFGQRKENAAEALGALGCASPFESQVVRSIKYARRIPKSPCKILDAPGILDDFYMDILDWSRTDRLAISLDNIVYHFENSERENNIVQLAQFHSTFATAVKFSPSGARLAVGNDAGSCHVYDIELSSYVATVPPHAKRVVSMSWMNEHVLSTGSRDATIQTHDTRARQVCMVHKKYTQEVCGLRWNENENYLASGGNENVIYIWDVRKPFPLQTMTEHKAAVRALAWSPHNFGTLVSGGGNHDKSIKIWNINSAESLATINTESQICNIVFSRHSNEFVSTHGFSKNQIVVWKADKRERVSVLEGHQKRVLHLALSASGEKVATAAADQTLKFWKVFPRDDPDPAAARELLAFPKELR